MPLFNLCNPALPKKVKIDTLDICDKQDASIKGKVNT